MPDDYFEMPCFVCGEIMLMQRGEKMRIYVDSKGEPHPFHETCQPALASAIEAYKNAAPREIANYENKFRKLD